MHNLVRLRDYRTRPQSIFFDRTELQQLLSVYSRRVISGEWRDYAIGHDARRATFSIFRHAADRPALTIVKVAASGPGEACYLLSAGPRRLKRGRSLAEVLAELERKPRLVYAAD